MWWCGDGGGGGGGSSGSSDGGSKLGQDKTDVWAELLGYSTWRGGEGCGKVSESGDEPSLAIRSQRP